MYAFAKPEAVRSFRESWKRDAECAICYWGEAWAWGSYLNAPMTAEEAPYAYAAIQKALALKAHADAEGARADRRDGGPLRRKFDAGEARRAGSRLRRRDAEGRRQVSRRPRDRHALRRCAVPARAAPRHARRQRPERQASASGARERAREATSIIRAPATSTCTPPNRRWCRAAPRRAPSFSATRFPAPATSTTCRRTRGTRSAAGAIRCARISRRGIRI